MSLYILDSDHLSLHQRGYGSLRNHLLGIPPNQLAITIISVEELVRGRLAQIRKSTKAQERIKAYKWLHQTLDFLCDFTVLEYDAKAEAYFQSLRAKKIRVGTQDLKIAAITLSRDAILVTRNRRDFEQVLALKFEDWTADNTNF